MRAHIVILDQSLIALIYCWSQHIHISCFKHPFNLFDVLLVPVTVQLTTVF